MSKYTLRPGLSAVFLPSIGRVTKGRILEGDFQKFVPQFLEEVVVATNIAEPEAVVEPPAPKIAEITAPVAEVVQSSEMAPALPDPVIAPVVSATVPVQSAEEPNPDEQQLISDRKGRKGFKKKSQQG